MKIEVILCSDIDEKCTGMTAFNTSSYVHNKIMHLNGFQGIVLIDNVPVKFSYSTLGDDGDIFTSNLVHRLIVKSIVPLHLFGQLEKDTYALAI